MNIIIIFASIVVGALAATIAITGFDAGFLTALGVYSVTGTSFVLALIFAFYAETILHRSDYY